MRVTTDFHEVTGPTERAIRTQADYEAFVSQIPLRQITKPNPAPPSKDPLLKKPFIDFAKHMVLIAIRTDSMYVCSHIESLVLDGQTLRVHVLDPDLGETRLLNQMRNIGTYRAVVVPPHPGPIQFHRKRGKPTPQNISAPGRSNTSWPRYIAQQSVPCAEPGTRDSGHAGRVPQFIVTLPANMTAGYGISAGRPVRPQ